MRWKLGDNDQYLRSECGRFYLTKFQCSDGPVYMLSDGNARICTERGGGAKERCMQLAVEIRDKPARSLSTKRVSFIERTMRFADIES